MKFNISIFLLIAFIINVSAQKKYSNKFINEKKNLVKKLTHESHKQTQIMVDKVLVLLSWAFMRQNHQNISQVYLKKQILKLNMKFLIFQRLGLQNGVMAVVQSLHLEVMLMEFRKLHNTLELHTIDQWLKEHLDMVRDTTQVFQWL